jgi:hypothetical protein
MAQEYGLPGSKFDEVASFLLANGYKVAGCGNRAGEDVSVFDFNGEPS